MRLPGSAYLSPLRLIPLFSRSVSNLHLNAGKTASYE